MGKLIINGDEAIVTPDSLGVHIEETGNKVLDIPLVADKLGEYEPSDIAEINENLAKCVIYNPTDDYLYINGVKWKSAGLNFNGVIYDGSDGGFKGGYTLAETGKYNGDYAVSTLPPFTIEDGYIHGTLITAYTITAQYLNKPIDFTGYSTLKFIINGTTYSFSVGGATSAYLAFSNYSVNSLVYPSATLTTCKAFPVTDYVFGGHDAGYPKASDCKITKIWLE